MTQDEFARQQIQLGHALHYHQGVWWEKQRSRPFFYKPASRLQEIVPGASRPSPLRALVGYSHAVPPGAGHSTTWPTMIATWDRTDVFSLDNLAGATAVKRSQVRRMVRTAQRELEIRMFHSCAELMHDLRQINIETALRTGAGRPPSYYTEQEDRWQAFIRSLFELPEREWWGAFYQERLIAYLYGYAIGRDWIVNTAKSLSDCMHLRPNDGLLFHAMERAINLHRCSRIVHGDWSENESKLTQFKAKHGFGRVDIPVQRSINPLVWWAREMRSRFRQGRGARAPIPVQEQGHTQEM
jgi:hypothetical protein